MKICFFGVGGVGGYFGTLATKRFKEKHAIYFVARGKHKDAIGANGLTLKRKEKNEIIHVFPEICTDTVEDLPVCDIIILSVKAYDLKDAVKEMSKIVDENTVILPLLNGVDIYERIREHLSAGIVLRACVYVGTHIESPGVISQSGGDGKIMLGSDPAFPDFYPESLLVLLNESGIDTNWEENVKISIWSKYMFIAAFGLVTATYEKTLGEIQENGGLKDITQAIMREIDSIAGKLNIPLSPDIVESSWLKAKQFPYGAKTSFQRDIESKGKIHEGDIFGGTIIRYGENLNVPVPTTKMVYEKLLKKIE